MDERTMDDEREGDSPDRTEAMASLPIEDDDWWLPDEAESTDPDGARRRSAQPAATPAPPKRAT